MDSQLRNVLVATAAMVVASGCAGRTERADANNAYQQDIARATASIEEAEKNGAFEAAGADLDRARQKLTAARKASEKGENEVARRLAVEADLDADVAAATARNQDMQNAVTELQNSISTLQDELRRNEQRGSSGRL